VKNVVYSVAASVCSLCYTNHDSAALDILAWNWNCTQGARLTIERWCIWRPVRSLSSG